MLYLAANHSRVWELRRAGWPLGWIMSPAGWRSPQRGPEELPYALDNGMFHAPEEPPRTDLAPFYAMVERVSGRGHHRPLFVVAPDVPYDGARSIERSRRHLPRLRELVDWPVALAVQDGMTPEQLEGFDAVFVAGSTAWKWRTAREWVEEARARGMWAHIARVNTRSRIEHCIDIGADSADGSGLFRGDKQQLASVLRALVQPTLEGAT